MAAAAAEEEANTIIIIIVSIISTIVTIIMLSTIFIFSSITIIIIFYCLSTSLRKGDLATSLGFYAADWRGGDSSKGEGGEALTVIDKTEAWVFHVLCDDTGASAVWAAQRLEPDHVCERGR